MPDNVRSVSSRRVVVAGAGLAGLRVAETLRRLGWEDEIVLVGEEDVPPYDRPPLSKDVLLGLRDPESVALRPRERLGELDLDLRLGVRATGLDSARRELATDAGPVGYDELVIATGSVARSLPLFDGLENAMTLRTLDEAIRLRDDLVHAGHVVVVGAGFIGSEIASAARERGIDVTVLELDPVPLQRVLGAELGNGFAALHRENGTDLRLGVTVERVERDGARAGRLHLTDGTAIEPDLVVVGVGAVPATAWLEGSGLELGNGVVCDDRLRASAPGVSAIGDVCSWPNALFGGRRMRVEHWTNASEQAGHVARGLIGEDTGPFRGSNFVWSDQYGVRIQFVGVASPDVAAVDGTIGSAPFLAWYREDGRVVGALAVDAPKLLLRSRKAIEAGATWEDALASLQD